MHFLSIKENNKFVILFPNNSGESSSFQAGFTLIELLIVIIIIAALSVVVSVALNPTKRLMDARNARRLTDIESIRTAINTYIVDKGGLPSGLSAGMPETQIGTSLGNGAGSGNPSCINTSGSCAAASQSCVDLTTPLTSFLKAIPQDPKIGSPSATGYSVSIDANNIVTVKACGIENTAIAGNFWYVSKNGSNADGKSWTTAWNELANINWSKISPGDTIYLDGGATACPSNYDFSNHATNRPGLTCGMLYSTLLNIQKSGTSTASAITIKLSPESAHNGTAVIFGGRTSMLPYCTQAYTVTGAARTDGIIFNTRAAGASFVTIDGSHRSGIMVYGAGDGVNLVSDNSTFDTLRNMEIFDNGIYMAFSGGGYHSDYPGIFLDGSNITIDRTLIHDNGQDGIQDNYTGYGTITHAPMHDMVVTESWLYNHRESPVWPGYSFNSGAEGNAATDCTHVDGIQIYGGGLDQQRLTVKDSIFGPLLGQGVYPGDQGNATFDNVTITNTLFFPSGQK